MLIDPQRCRDCRNVAALVPAYFLAVALLTSTAGTGLATRPDRPNIVFILVDDQGYYDLGCYGATEFETPRIDRMAAEGVRFTDYYAAAPICSPSRAGLLTGCYPRRVGLATWVQRADSNIGLHADELTIAELLKASGYATACIGKWHLGFHEPFLPQNQGFDHYFGLLHNLDPVEVVYFERTGGVPLLRGREVVRAMDWYPTLATFAEVEIPDGRIIDGRDMSALLTGRSNVVPPPEPPYSLNAYIPLRRPWNPPGEWKELISRDEYNDAFFYHGSQGALAAVRWKQWKLYLNPNLQLYDLERDPGETNVVRNGAMLRKLRGMVVLFQEEMRDHARPVGKVTSR